MLGIAPKSWNAPNLRVRLLYRTLQQPQTLEHKPETAMSAG